MKDRIREFLSNLIAKDKEEITFDDDYFRRKVREKLVEKGEFYTNKDAQIIGKLNDQERKEYMQKMTSFYLKAKNFAEENV